MKMWKSHFWQNSWFTLIEMIVGIFIGITVLVGIWYIFELTGSGIKDIQFRSRIFWDLEILQTHLRDTQKNYPTVLNTYGNIFPHTWRGFHLEIRTNSWETSGKIFGVFDSVSQKMVYGNIENYSKYNPAFVELESADLTLAKNNIDYFIENLDPKKITYFPNLNLIKLSYSPIGQTEISQLDIIYLDQFLYEHHEQKINDVQYMWWFVAKKLSLIP